MNVNENLLNFSNSQSLPEWQAYLKQQVNGLSYLFYHNDALQQRVDRDISIKSQLIMMGKQFNTLQLQSLLQLLTSEQVTTIRLSKPEVIAGVTVISLDLNAFPTSLKAKLDLFAQQNKLDFALMEKFPDWNKPGLVLMDMDSTTIQIECIDEIARLYGVGEQVSAVTAQAMQGKLDFNESLRTRVGKLENAPQAILKEVADNMPLMPGLKVLLTGLKSAGWKVAIASGGFNYFADRLKVDLGFDSATANSLEIIDETLTGKVIGEIVNAQVKARTLNELATKFSVDMAQTVAIGDGANDLKMMAHAGLGVAVHGKPKVVEQAQAAICQGSLLQLLYMLAVPLNP
ncbi:MAG: phosphoserine phosphatase SerB, partial [Psychromonas sp.]